MSLVGLIVLTALPHSVSKIAANEMSTPVVQAEATTTSPKPDYFEPLVLDAHSVIVYDITHQKVLFERDATSTRPLASLTKIMTAITATNMTSSSTVITIGKNDLAEEGDSGLLPDEKWTLAALLKYSLVVSSNDGAAAVANALGSASDTLDASTSQSNAVFIAKMNERAQMLGLKNSVFFNSTGLDESATRAGAYGSATDVAKMLVYAINNQLDIFEATSKPTIAINSLDNISHTGINTDTDVAKIPGLIAGKTGYTDLAGGNLAVVFDANSHDKIVVVVLGSGYDSRFTDVEKLSAAAVKTVSH